MRPRRRQPTRLLCPWDFPGKNTGVGYHFLLPCMHAKSFSRVQLCATLWTTAHQAPLSMGSPGKNTGAGCHFPLHHPLYKIILRIFVRIPSFNSVSYPRGILFIVQGVVEVGLRIVFSSCLSPDLKRTGGISFLLSSFLLNISHI